MGKDEHAKKKPKKAAQGPGPEDAQVVLKLYDLRREPVMRESRNRIVRWQPESYEDLRTITTFDAPDNAAFRQVSSYFELAFGLARHGAVDAELLVESCGEGLLLYAKVQPFLERFREEVSPTAFRNAEWAAERTEAGKARYELFRARLGGD